MIGIVVGYVLGYDERKEDDEILKNDIVETLKGRIDWKTSFEKAIADIEDSSGACPYMFDYIVDHDQITEACRRCANRDYNSMAMYYDKEKSIDCWKEVFEETWNI